MISVPSRRSPVYAGIDLGATKIEVVITGADFTPPAQARSSHPGAGRSLRGGHRHQGARSSGGAGLVRTDRTHRVGIGVPGQVDPVTGAVARSPNIRGWTASYPLRD